MKQQHKVLMLCYYFPPILTSGIARSVGFARQLECHGWTPHVLTVKEAKESWESSVKSPVPDGIDITRTTELNLSGLLDFLQGVSNRIYRLFTRRDLETPLFRRWFGLPDAHYSWWVFGKGRELARQSDCIYVSCSPFSAGVLAVILKRLVRKPLVVDFRDPWTIHLNTAKDRWLERLVIRNSDQLILNTDETLRWYREQYPEYAERMTCIPNGFDKPVVAIRPECPDDVTTVVHTGSFYLDRKPDLLLQAIQQISDCKIRFIQVGKTTPALETYKSDLDIVVTGQLPPQQALDHMARADILYLKQGPSLKECVAAKTYEYLTTGRPILAECSPDADAAVIEKYATAFEIVSEEDVDQLVGALRRLLSIAKTHDKPPRAEYLSKYDRKALTRDLADVLDETVGRP